MDDVIDFKTALVVEAAYRKLSPGDRQRFIEEVNAGESLARLVGRFLRAARQHHQGAEADE